jgi:hypothetical protein
MAVPDGTPAVGLAIRADAGMAEGHTAANALIEIPGFRHGLRLAFCIGPYNHLSRLLLHFRRGDGYQTDKGDQTESDQHELRHPIPLHGRRLYQPRQKGATSKFKRGQSGVKWGQYHLAGLRQLKEKLTKFEGILEMMEPPKKSEAAN